MLQDIGNSTKSAMWKHSKGKKVQMFARAGSLFKFGRTENRFKSLKNGRLTFLCADEIAAELASSGTRWPYTLGFNKMLTKC